MGIWIAYLLLGVLAAAAIAVPLLRKDKTTSAEAAEVEGEGAPMKSGPAATGWITRTRAITAGGVVLVLAAAAALFVATEDKPVQAGPLGMANPASGATKGLPDVDTMITRLAKRLEASPNDPEGWRMLGWSYFATQRFADAANAYAKAVALTPGDAGFQSAYGEALVKAGGDRITPQAEAALRKALSIDPKDERARTYLARLKHQNGDSQGAIKDLFGILKSAAADSPHGPTIRDAIRKVAGEAKIDVSDRLPPEPAAPSPSDVQAIQQLPAQDQQAMIDGMVGRLETRLASNPKDVDGWIMLMRSRKTLGQMDQSKAALAKAREVFVGDAAAKARLDEAAQSLGVG